MPRRKDPLLRLDVPKRRGLPRDPDINTWDAVLVRGDLDKVARRLLKSRFCGEVLQHVTFDALKGKLHDPAGEWALLLKLRGHDWCHVVTARGSDFDLPAQLARATKVEVIHLGYQDTANSTYFTYYDEGKVRIA